MGIRVEGDKDTLVEHTLALNNNPEEDAPWVAKRVKRTEKREHYLLFHQPIPP